MSKVNETIKANTRTSLFWDDVLGRPAISRNHSEGSWTPLDKPSSLPKLKKFGQWENGDYFSVSGILTAGGLFAGLFSGMLYDGIVNHTSSASSTGLTIFAAMTIIGALAYPVFEIVSTYWNHFADKKRVKALTFPLYEAYCRRPHQADEEAPYSTFMVHVVDDKHLYQVLEINPYQSSYQVLLDLPAPKDINAAAEMGVEMAALVRQLEQDSKDKYEAALKVAEVDKALEMEMEMNEKMHAQTLTQVMRSAVEGAS